MSVVLWLDVDVYDGQRFDQHLEMKSYLSKDFKPHSYSFLHCVKVKFPKRNDAIPTNNTAEKLRMAVLTFDYSVLHMILTLSTLHIIKKNINKSFFILKMDNELIILLINITQYMIYVSFK